jgi:hypothetical protein
MTYFKHRISPVVAVVFFICALFAFAAAEENSPNAGEQLKWQVVSGGGTTSGTSSGYKLSSTVGQTAAGAGTSASYKLNQGFQQNFAAACFCGDANGSGAISISDAVMLINYIFAGGTAPNPICRGDANGSGAISISDAVYLIRYIFAGGPAPHCS